MWRYLLLIFTGRIKQDEKNAGQSQLPGSSLPLSSSPSGLVSLQDRMQRNLSSAGWVSAPPCLGPSTGTGASGERMWLLPAPGSHRSYGLGRWLSCSPLPPRGHLLPGLKLTDHHIRAGNYKNRKGLCFCPKCSSQDSWGPRGTSAYVIRLCFSFTSKKSCIMNINTRKNNLEREIRFTSHTK